MADFDARSTTDDVLAGVDLARHRVVVTGASTGLGEETARSLAAHGAAVTMAVRDLDRGRAAADRIRSTVPEADLELREVDLASLDSVASFADELVDAHPRVDVLVNNAGIMACPFGLTRDGFELQFGTNHLGHFLLTTRLLPALLAAPAPRVVSLSSSGHRFGDVDLDDHRFERTPYDPWVAYGRSKTANALLAVALAGRFGSRGLAAYSVHPGGIITELGRHLTKETMAALVAAVPPGQRLEWKSVEAGAATSVWAATTTSLAEHNGAYLEDCGVAAVTEDPELLGGVRPYAVDPDHAEALWVRSEELVRR